MSDSTSETKTCTVCEQVYPATTEYFHQQENGKYGLRAACKTCINKGLKKPQLPEGYKLCSKCGELKPATSDFFHSGKVKDGLYSVCKVCRSAANRKYPPKPIPPEGYKYCTMCAELKPATLEYFYAQDRGMFGLNGRCIDCHKQMCSQSYENNKEQRNAYSRQYYQENREYMRQIQKEYREANKDELAKASRQYYQENKEQHNQKTKQYYEANKEYILQQQTEYRKQHADEIAAYQREYRQKHKARIRVKQREWETENRDRVNARARANHPKYRVQKAAYAKYWAFKNRDKRALYQARRRARKLGLPDTFTHGQWIACLEYFNYCCAVCGLQLRDLFGNIEPHQDHWIPIASDECIGTVAENMVCLCNGCNLSKGAKMPLDWLIRDFGKRKAAEILQRIQAYFDSLST